MQFDNVDLLPQWIHALAEKWDDEIEEEVLHAKSAERFFLSLPNLLDELRKGHEESQHLETDQVLKKLFELFRETVFQEVSELRPIARYRPRRGGAMLAALPAEATGQLQRLRNAEHEIEKTEQTRRVLWELIKLAIRGAIAVKDEMAQGGRTPGASQDKDIVSIEAVVERAAKQGLEELTATELELLERGTAAARAKKQPLPETEPQTGQVISTKSLASFEEFEELKHAVDVRLDLPKDEAKQPLGEPLETKPLAAYLSKRSKKRNFVPPPSLDELVQTFETATKMVVDVGEITSDLTSKQWGQVMEVSAAAKSEKHQIEVKERFNKACQAIEEFRGLEEVTAKDLTRYFAKKHRAAKIHLKRTEGEVLPDEKKQELVELVDAFRATGGVVKLDGKPCIMDLNKTKSMKQCRFLVRSADADLSGLWTNIKVPPLKFKN